jgi:site-specific DNA recombinase
MKKFYAYIRVSTIKQGEKGSSLQEQRDAIERYAQKSQLLISAWYEEQETAAKRGRTIFRRMLTQLKKGGSHGLVMHKIDRGARNLADWAELASLIDHGIEVHFAHEGTDLKSRGGRLAADIQAVVAADYIRNLRDEVKKGIYGRLKQGLWPFNAPIGYKNNGGGAVKSIDPVQGPLVRKAFTLYTTGHYSMRSLCAHMNDAGLRSCYGRPLSLPAFGKLLQNTFYYGLLEIKGQTYLGIHEPLIDKQLFDRARLVAEGKAATPTRERVKREFALRGMVKCSICTHSLYGELQKGNTYYRCHSQSCKGTSFRESDLVFEVLRPFTYISLLPDLPKMLAAGFEKARTERLAIIKSQVHNLQLRIGQVEAKQDKLTDIYIEGSLDAESYQRRRSALHNERLALIGEVEAVQKKDDSDERQQEFFELLKALQTLPFSDNSHFKRDVVKTVISNFSVNQKTVELQRSEGFEALANIVGVSCGALELTPSRKQRRSVTLSDRLLPIASICPICSQDHLVNIEVAIQNNIPKLVSAIRNDTSLDGSIFKIG